LSRFEASPYQSFEDDDEYEDDYENALRITQG
jgi:hypothetical protein